MTHTHTLRSFSDRRCQLLAAATFVLCVADVAAQSVSMSKGARRHRFSIAPGTTQAAAGDILRVPTPSGLIGQTLPVAVSAASLGLPATANIDALAVGADRLPDMSSGGTTGSSVAVLSYSITAASVGWASGVTRQTSSSGNGGAGDQFRTHIYPYGGPIPRIYRRYDATHLLLAPRTPTAEPELDAATATRRGNAGFYFSVTAASAPAVSTALGFAVGPADILYSAGPGSTPVIYATAATLMLGPGDDVDALCVHDRGRRSPPAFDPTVDQIAYSLTPSSPSTMAVIPGTTTQIFPSAGLHMLGAGAPPFGVVPAVFGLLSTDDLDSCRCTVGRNWRFKNRQPLGGRIAGMLDDDGGITGAGLHGVTRTAVGNVVRYWVTQQRLQPSAPHLLLEYDEFGTLVASHAQPAATAISATGIRDLCTDGSHLYGCLEGNTVHAFDLAVRGWDALERLTLAPSVPPVLLGIAYDGTNDTFWLAGGGGELVQVDRGGNVDRTFTGVVTQPRGLAMDEERARLWVFCGGGGPRPGDQAVGVEFDVELGEVTGVQFLGDAAIGGQAAGLDFYLDDTGAPLLVCVTKGAAGDDVYEISGSYTGGTTCPGGNGEMSQAGLVGA
ncbi:MAG: hypothetical protein KDC98_03230, partial [Planctomycetes bacterium]|nr:hypothetical protein [Planctomycetota bacterium]